MGAPVGFWSYVHNDDDADRGRIVQLAHDIVAEMGLQTGEDIDLFIDQDALSWGTVWQGAIDEGLGRVAFFIPVLTPRYFNSVQCRRELQTFARRATELGIKELVMPILYIGVPDLLQDSPADDLVTLVKTFQWQDWTNLRLSDRESSAYRTAVRVLAIRLVEANRKAEQSASQTIIDSDTSGGEGSPPDGAKLTDSELDDELGAMDLLAQTEQAMPAILVTAQAMGVELAELGPMFDRATVQMGRSDSNGGGFAGRIRVARTLANELEPLADRFYEQCNSFTTQLHIADPGIRILIGGLATEASRGKEELATACEYFESIRALDLNIGISVTAAEAMMKSAQPVEAMSRDLRPGLRRLRASVTILQEGRTVIGGWITLVDQSGVECRSS